MAQYVVTGGNKLKGTVRIEGNKNEVLPCMAAALLTKEPVTLKNVPAISDVGVFKELLKRVGAKVEEGEGTLSITAARIESSVLPEDLTSRLRASILMAGPLLARTGKAGLHHPGGDVIGIRTLAPHLDGFEAMGYSLKQGDRYYELHQLHHKGAVKIFMEEASVTGVENLIMAAVLRRGETTIRNAPEEPHVVHLCQMLTQMGAKISGIGSSTIVIQGVEELHGTEFEIGADFIEIGTYAAAAAMTNGELLLTNCSLEGLEPIIIPLRKMGVVLEEERKGVLVKRGKLKALPLKLHTNIWPGFPTDLMSVAIVLATQCEGVSLMMDWMYESRMYFVDKLIGMGAHITIADPHRVVIYGPTPLRGRTLETPDIRAGIAMVLAALIAEGTSTINRAELIERGYVGVVEKLTELGADIKRID